MVHVKEEKKIKGEKKMKGGSDLGKLQQTLEFKIEPSQSTPKAIDTSEWPLLLKVSCGSW